MKNYDKAIKILSGGSEIECEYASVLRKAKEELIKARNELEVERKRFYLDLDLKEKNLESQNKLFDLKWNMLEEETRRLAEDEKKAEKRRQFFERVDSFEGNDGKAFDARMFFEGVTDLEGLKKRYKELIRIYHPDAQNGDKRIVQEINREYALLKRKMS